MINKANNGFTLLELVIVIAMVAVLAAIAIPAYGEYVKKSRRADGQAGLMSELQAQERLFSGSGTYTARTKLSDEGHYSISGQACSGSTLDVCIQLTATPQGAQASDKCGNLIINSKLEKSRSGSELLSKCW